MEQGKHSVRHKVHTESDEEERTLVHIGVVHKAGIGGGLQKRHNPSLLFGARNVQPSARHGFNPEAQCKHRELEKGGKWQFAPDHVADDAALLAAEVLRAVLADVPKVASASTRETDAVAVAVALAGLDRAVLTLVTRRAEALPL